jgi:PAS domain S-box-containing protein
MMYETLQVKRMFYAAAVLMAGVVLLNQLYHSWIILVVGLSAVLGGLWVNVFRPMLGGIRQTLQWMKLQQEVAIAANNAESVREGLQAGIDSICGYTGWKVGHAYIFSEEKKTLVSAGAWHITSSLAAQAFMEASQVLDIRSSRELVGEVYTGATPMWILDVERSTAYTRKTAALACGLKAVFAFPIMVGKRVLGVLEFYPDDARIPDEELLELMANIGNQLGQVIERTQFMDHAKLLETVIASASDGVTITKADLISNGPEIVYVNEAFSRITGYAATEAIGKTLCMLNGEQTSEDTLHAMRKALHAGEPFKAEILNYTKEGNYVWVDISIVPVRNARGDITHFAAMQRDITELKSADRQLKETMIQIKRANMKSEAAARDLEASLKKAEEANKAKGDFLANMSHELRTPMNGVLGMAQLLADTALDTEQRECVSTINGSAENLLMLLNDILDFSKIEAGALQLEHLAFDMRDALNGTVNLLRSQADKKQIALVSNITPFLPEYVWGDPGRTRQILTNLLGNAIKFTNAGHVRLVTDIHIEDSGDWLHISVEDTGMGIPAAKLDEIFDKFTQADASVTRKYGGTGLGLAITKQLVSLMGGRIGVESAEGKGSTFWFTIPCKPASQNDVLRPREQSSAECEYATVRMPVAEARVLLVEDYPVNQMFAMKLLRKFGFCHIDLAENGVEAIQKYRTNMYDVIFMDCQMPELDGYQTTAKLRLLEEGTTLHTPIVAMTANAMMGDREKCLKAGMDDYISKPLRAEHLKAIIRHWFEIPDEKAQTSIAVVNSAQAPSATDAIVDLEQLRMFTDGDPEEERALFELFLEQAHEMIILLEQSKQTGDNERWKSAAHRFKGSSGNLGANRLHHACREAEARHTEDPLAKDALLAAIKTETDHVSLFFAEAFALNA